MDRPVITVGAAEANRRFSKLLKAVREGARVTITSHGEPVAELAPSDRAAVAEEKARIAAAHDRLIRHLRSRKPKLVGPWTRDELYDRDRH